MLFYIKKKRIQMQSAHFSIILKLDAKAVAAATPAAAVTSPQLHCVALLQLVALYVVIITMTKRKQSQPGLVKGAGH
jgi:hypothetical protein